ncbi:MAG: hypothetical protein IK013_01930 [Bacteroidales bacterium]|nr:hypothetical protein [Bacteroidales bacterium]
MKFRQILFVLLSVMCFSTISAQQLTPKKQQKFAELVNLTAFAGNTLCDKSYVRNVDWLEYQWWLEKTYGKESEQYNSSILDVSAARALMPDSIAVVYANHPQFRNRPVLGVSPEQAAAYCRWRSDRVAESMLVQQLKVRTFQFTTDTNIFTLDSYIAPEGVQFLRFFVPAEMDTRYGFYCFAVWK